MFGKKTNELPIPAAARTDPKAREIARIWGAYGEQHVSLDPGLWPDPGAWGIMLADLARHAANYYTTEHRMDRQEVLNRIHQLLEAEWERPTSEVRGGPIT